MEYLPLASSPDDIDEAKYARTERRPRGNAGQHNLIFWACIGAICSSALSVVLFASTTLFPPKPSAIPLRRPSQYIHMQSILQSSNFTYPPITNFPPIVMQIDTADKQRAMHQDERGWYPSPGSIYPDDRHIVISREHSSVAQFRHLDFGMERCVLTASLPFKTDTFDPTISLTSPSTIDVWILDQPHELSPYTPGTWDRAAKRTRKLATLTFSSDAQTSSDAFRCPSAEFSTFELACAESQPDCRVDFWQDQRILPVGGLYITQTQTVPEA
ncbi:hypothetical protein OF83DRAFT_1242529 [Amylostereum chailletii]|nr:hypothetical protein OF83DRAFT_1242529 [Amylostereum chailletii]